MPRIQQENDNHLQNRSSDKYLHTLQQQQSELPHRSHWIVPTRTRSSSPSPRPCPSEILSAQYNTCLTRFRSLPIDLHRLCHHNFRTRSKSYNGCVSNALTLCPKYDLSTGATQPASNRFRPPLSNATVVDVKVVLCVCVCVQFVVMMMMMERE